MQRTRSPRLPDPRQWPAWVITALGLAFLAAAWRMNADWFDDHILPNFFMPRHTQWTIAIVVRGTLTLTGLTLVLTARSLLAGLGTKAGAMTAAAALMATITALASAECILRLQGWQAFHARDMEREPRRQADPRLGWLHVPGHSGQDFVGGRLIGYAFDRHGYRVPFRGTETDPAIPSILFTGESVMVGFGLDWKETIPALVQGDLGLHSANLAVTGYSADQSFLRLQQELPRFRCPVAIVSIFMASFLERNINTDRPHLDANLRWHPPAIGWRLAATARNALDYRSDAVIARGIAMTAATFRASEALARSRGARLLVVVPVFMPEGRAERAINRRVLDAAGVEQIVVPLDPRWRIPGDYHPDAKAAQVIASAITARLRRDGGLPVDPSGRYDPASCQTSGGSVSDLSRSGRLADQGKVDASLASPD